MLRQACDENLPSWSSEVPCTNPVLEERVLPILVWTADNLYNRLMLIRWYAVGFNHGSPSIHVRCHFEPARRHLIPGHVQILALADTAVKTDLADSCLIVFPVRFKSVSG